MVQGGWSPQQFADAPGGFTLAELDGAAPRNPLFVQQGYSIVYANTLALRAVGLDPKDGAQRNAAGLATFQPPYGAFIERIPPTTPEQFERNLTDFMRTLNGVGLTGVYSLGRGPEGESERIEARALREDLPLRIWETLTFEATDAAAADAAVALIERSRPNTFRDDFGLFGLGEHVYLPFFDLPNQAGPWPKRRRRRVPEARGGGGARRLAHPRAHDDELQRRRSARPLRAAERDAADRRACAGRSRTSTTSRRPTSRARKRSGITLGVHGVAMHGAAKMPLRTIQDSGIVWGLGTDATIVSHYQPFVTLGWVVSGLDLAGRRVLDETVTREEALIAHTRSNAYLFFQEDALGSLEVGKQADLVVLDRDYMTVPAAEIKDIEPTLTMVGGRLVFRAAP